MPIYEYKCRKCGKQFELFQKMSDEDISSCRFCDGPVKKLMSLSSFHLKGSGWYTTDYGGKKPSTTEREKKEETKAETAAPSSSETAAKTE